MAIDALRVHELRVGAVVDQLRHLVGQQPAGGGVGGGVGERERDALEVEDARAALLALQRPGDGLVEQPPHRADAARGDVDALLDEPRVLQLAAAADHLGAAEHGVRRHLESKRIVGWPCG